MKKRKVVPTFLMTAALCFLLICVMLLNKRNIEKLTMEQLIMEKTMMIDDVISRLLYKTEALSAILMHSNGEIEDFERVAAVIADDPVILNILIAPSGVVSDVYPLQGNEAVIGLDFFKEGAGNKEAVMAKELGELVFGGPFNLVQGGQALVGRLPVYIDAADGGRNFWGLVSITLKYPHALEGAGLHEIERDGLSYMIWRINPDDNEKQVIASSEKYNDKHLRYIEKPLHILNADWNFRVASGRSWYEYTETWILAVVGLCISFLAAFFVQRNIELKHAKAALERKVSESTLLTEELTKAKKQAEQASNAKSSFLANINHEIRTPMSGIIGFAELAADSDIDKAEMKDYLDKIGASAEGLLGIIDNILVISKIESGNIQLEKVPFDIKETLTLCGAISNLKAMEKGLDLSVQLEPPVTKKLMGDPTKLRQILLNLLSNAVKFTKEGRVLLRASAVNIGENDILILFEVKDSGIGMSPDQIETIFEPFMQGDNTTTREYGGSGLGLAIAQNLLQLMGSRLEVESVRNIGSIFRFALTFELSNEPAEIFESKANKPTFKAEALVCEDNETNQLVIQRHLSKMGIGVTIAQNGKIGVELAQTRMQAGNPFDLIFMDIHMPVMDGLQAARKLMEIGNKSPVIALTANIMVNDIENYQNHGMPVYIGKPFKAKELRECLLKYLTPVEPSDSGTENATNEAPPQDQGDFNNAVIDRVAGIDQYEGDEKTYEIILASFAKNNMDSFRNLKDALDAGDRKLAHRIAHSLKGAAGTIAATRLAVAAFDVENALLNSNGEETGFDNEIIPVKQMKSLEIELNAVYEELGATVKETKKNERETIDPDREKILALINRLMPLLETGNAKSLELLDEIEATFQPVIEKCKLFITQMEHYDFELAYETVQSIQRLMQ